jgi:hypothetical protein
MEEDKLAGARVQIDSAVGPPSTLALSFPSHDSVFLSILFAWGSRFLIFSCSFFAPTPGASIQELLDPPASSPT